MDATKHTDTRPPPKDLSHHLSRVTRAREASSIKRFYKYFAIPGMGQIAGGLPNAYYFPFDTLEAKVARPERWHPTPNNPVDPPPTGGDIFARSSSKSENAISSRQSPLNQPQDAIEVPHTSSQADVMKKIDLSTALQYGQADGYPPLRAFIREFTRDHMHPNCPYQGGPEVILTVGNTDGWSKCLSAFTNEWSEEKDWIRDKDGVLVEYFSYSQAWQAVRPRGLNVVPVLIDDEGMVAEGRGGLRDVLENWDFKKGRRPRLMYTVTMGQNPTSGVLSLQRRRDIYELCCKYDIIVVEDDPYWYLQYPSATAMNTTTTAHAANTSFNPDVAMFANAEPRPEGWKSSGYAFLDSLVPSSIQIDTEGRVIRLDTFSKTVAPGCRLGWITAQPALIERIMRITETSTQQPSGFVQSMIAQLLLGPGHSDAPRGQVKNRVPDGQGWKGDGWVRWIEGLRGNYERRMNEMARILENGKYLVKTGRRNSLGEAMHDEMDVDGWSVVEKTQMIKFDWPVGGMFLWLQVLFENHPLYSHFRKADELDRLSEALWIFWTTKPYLVLCGVGQMFSPSEEIRKKYGWRYFRLCFAAVNEDQIEPITQRLVDGLVAFFKIKDRKTIEELLEEDQNALARRAGEEEIGKLTGPC